MGISMVNPEDKSAALQIGIIILMFVVVGVILVIAANIIA
jgi:hypothetical protein